MKSIGMSQDSFEWRILHCYLPQLIINIIYISIMNNNQYNKLSVEHFALTSITDQQSLLEFLNSTNPSISNLTYSYTDIDLRVRKLTPKMITNFNKLLKYLDTKKIYITNLNLNNCQMTKGMVATLFAGIMLPQCTYLYLSGNTLGGTDAIALAKSLGTSSSLQSLKLDSCGLKAGNIAKILAKITLSQCTDLQICDGNYINQADVDAITKSLSGNPNGLTICKIKAENTPVDKPVKKATPVDTPVKTAIPVKEINAPPNITTPLIDMVDITTSPNKTTKKTSILVYILIIVIILIIILVILWYKGYIFSK